MKGRAETSPGTDEGAVEEPFEDTPGAAPGRVSWKRDLARSLCRARDIEKVLGVTAGSLEAVCAAYPARISPSVRQALSGPCGGPENPVWRQFVPDPREPDGTGEEDPLCEEAQSPVPGLVHRYPDRVLFQVETRCAVYCRYCLRKRLVGKKQEHGKEALEEGIGYIRKTPAVREVVLSGGDPLLLEDSVFFGLLSRLRDIPHVEVLRVHTRAPLALPSRITPAFARRLARFFPVYMNVQANHPSELGGEGGRALRILGAAGIPLGSQSVLLRGVNDSAETLAGLFTALLRLGVRPYYLHHLDRVRGAGHFYTPPGRGLRIMETLRARVSGMALPRYVVDLPGGAGKAALSPQTILGRRGGKWRVRSATGRVVEMDED